MSGQCTNIKADRDIGAMWERRFGLIALRYGHTVTPNQIGRNESAAGHYQTADGYKKIILPDFVIWSFGGQHHEIKHKSPARSGPRAGCYGLERYRFESLKHFQSVCQQRVFYTIHDHEMAGGKYAVDCSEKNWLTISISDMEGTHQHEEIGPSWCNGKKIQTEIMYWHKSLFVPLVAVLDKRFERAALPVHAAHAGNQRLAFA
jgi:hypothetical protein